MNEPLIPIVSVIIPAYNAGEFIDETLQSVASQSIREIEVLIIDDGSTDNLKNIVMKYTESDYRFKYIHQDNKGVSCARNNGFRQSKGQYIAFLDADDIWLKDNLALKLEKFSKGNYGMVHSDGFRIDKYSVTLEGLVTGREGWLLDDLLLWRSGQIPGPSSILVKRDVIQHVGPFNEKMSVTADKDFFIRVAAKYEIGRVELPTWKYRIHDSNMHKNIAVMERDNIYLYRNLSRSRLFRSKGFERKCYSRLYWVLAASWRGDGKNYPRFISFLLKAIWKNPAVLGDLLSIIMNKWLTK